MRFLFFNTAGGILFERSDAESASVTHEEMTFQAIFPYVPEKEILRGMRIGYEDALGIFQVFEIRKVRTLEPDHFQEVSAEHIAISELMDEFAAKAEWTNITASTALSPLLANTGWAIGTDTTSNTSSGDLSNGNVWNATRLIQQNWNVYIIPRIVVGTSGITNKYLDIMPAEGTWRGFRISLDKNANEIGVIWDDSKLKTALYAFGQEKNKTPLTFKDVVWTTSGGDPVNKPANQTYVEDPTATANYGRNGRPRFGYYQNASITDAATLLQKTWEVLQTVSVPDVTVNANVSDLHRLGYVDVPLRLHDTALIEIRPTGVILQKEIIQYTEDLLDPLQSRLTIGTYIPNIIYINRENARRGGGGGGSGDSQTPQEYTTENNTVQITIDSNGLNSLCVGIGAQLNPDGSLVIDPETGKPIFVNESGNMYSQIAQNASNIELKVSKDGVIAAINLSSEQVTISAAKINLEGYVTLTDLAGTQAVITTIKCANLSSTTFNTGNATATDVTTTTLHVASTGATWQSKSVVTGGTKTGNQWFALSSNGQSITGTMYTSLYSSLSTSTIHYLGY
jgi:phage minor structural protein